jgi:hypothetical protein
MVRKSRVKAALAAARRLAELTRDAATAENTLRRSEWHERQRQVQRQARTVERLTAELGITAEQERSDAKA